MTNYAHGHAAEKHAAEYLRRRGYKVLALNWRRPSAEIDIVAQRRHGPVTFVEVKYRERTHQGGGLDYITARKLERMRYAAELWTVENRYDGECMLAALEMSGPDFTVTDFIVDVI